MKKLILIIILFLINVPLIAKTPHNDSPRINPYKPLKKFALPWGEDQPKVPLRRPVDFYPFIVAPRPEQSSQIPHDLLQRFLETDKRVK